MDDNEDGGQYQEENNKELLWVTLRLMTSTAGQEKDRDDDG